MPHPQPGSTLITVPAPGRHEPSSLRTSLLAGLRARMIGETAFGCTRWVSLISMPAESDGGERIPVVVLGQRSGDAAGPVGHVGAGGDVRVGVGHHVGDGETAAGPGHTGGLTEQRARRLTGWSRSGTGPRRRWRPVAGGLPAADEFDVGDSGLAGVTAPPGRACRWSCRGRWPAAGCGRGCSRRGHQRPAPNRRSKTVSPGCRSATAAGMPQPE